jgi:hypothetical protein
MDYEISTVTHPIVALTPFALLTHFVHLIPSTSCVSHVEPGSHSSA